VTSGVPFQMVFSDVTPADGFTNGLKIVNTAGSFVPPVGNYMVGFNLNNHFTGNSTQSIIELWKNGSLMAANTGLAFNQYPSGADAVFDSVLSPIFVTANGTDAFTVNVANTYSSGTSIVGGTFTWMAV